MTFTNLTDTRRFIAYSYAAIVASLALMRAPGLADPYQPVRALLLGLVLALCVFAIDRAVLDSLRWEFAPLAVAVLGVGVSAVVNGPASALYGVHGRYLGVVTGLALCGAAVAGALVMARHTRALVVALAVSGSVQAVWVLAQRLTGGEVLGATGNSVLSGGWLAVAAGAVGAAALVWRGAGAWWIRGAAVLIAVGAVASGSRGAAVAVGLAAVLLGAWWVWRGQPRRFAWFAGAVAAVVVVAGVVVLVAPPQSLGAVGREGSSASRIEIMRGAAALVTQRPLTGVGPGRFLYEYPRVETERRVSIESGDVRADQAHSEVLQLAAEAGVPAALAVVAFMGLAIVWSVRAAGAGDAAGVISAGALFAAAGYSLFGISTVEIGAVVWTFAGVGIARGALLRASTQDGVAGLPAARWLAVGMLLVAGTAVAAASAVFMAADARYVAGLEAFSASDFARAASLADESVALAPTVDIYRVARADVALYDRADDKAAALALVERGLALEPGSYDLLMQRARLLAASRAPASVIGQAHLEALRRYPRGVEVRAATVAALRAAGDERTAARVESGETP